MKQMRKMIEIDEALCNGCGQCILGCAEGALELVDGKAKLIGEVYCDGLGACIGECPEGALTIVEREADEFDEAAVEELLERKAQDEAAKSNPMPCGCPGAMARSLAPTAPAVPAAPAATAVSDAPADKLPSELAHWPIKLQLLGPQAPFLKGADLVLLADCAGVAFPDVHRKILRGRAIAIGCPKLDDLEAHIERLAQILAGAKPKSLTVVHMEVPCCRGFVHAAEQAIEQAGVDIPLSRMMIGVQGELLEEENMNVLAGQSASGCAT